MTRLTFQTRLGPVVIKTNSDLVSRRIMQYPSENIEVFHAEVESGYELLCRIYDWHDIWVSKDKQWAFIGLRDEYYGYPEYRIITNTAKRRKPSLRRKPYQGITAGAILALLAERAVEGLGSVPLDEKDILGCLSGRDRQVAEYLLDRKNPPTDRAKMVGDKIMARVRKVNAELRRQS